MFPDPCRGGGGGRDIILHSLEGDSKKVHPEEMIIDRGEAEVANHFRRVNILTITLSGMYYIFIGIEKERFYKVKKACCIF